MKLLAMHNIPVTEYRLEEDLKGIEMSICILPRVGEWQFFQI
jgi:hypothetical protein